MVKRLKLTEDIISLISNFRFKKINDKMSGFDTYDLYGGTYLYEDMALILGKFDQMIPEQKIVQWVDSFRGVSKIFQRAR